MVSDTTSKYKCKPSFTWYKVNTKPLLGTTVTNLHSILHLSYQSGGFLGSRGVRLAARSERIEYGRCRLAWRLRLVEHVVTGLAPLLLGGSGGRGGDGSGGTTAARSVAAAGTDRRTQHQEPTLRYAPRTCTDRHYELSQVQNNTEYVGITIIEHKPIAKP